MSIGRKMRIRLALPCILFMLLSSLDRSNMSFAAAGMNVELDLSASQYGLAAGILFIGYLAGQYPSLFLYQRLGMSRWIAGCALLWGGCALGMAFITTPLQLYVLRVMMGLGEAGLVSGIVMYLGQFATERERATIFALPMLAIPASIIVGGPLSGWLMSVANPMSVSGWRYMYVMEAVPTLVMGLLALGYFPDRPGDAAWLTDAEKDWLATHATVKRTGTRQNDWSMLWKPVVWISALLWFCLLCGAYGIIFWLPQIVGSMSDLSATAIGVVGALPWVGVGLGIYFNSQHSDKTGERYWHTGLPVLSAAMALLFAWQIGNGWLALLGLLVTGLGLGAAQGTFWALPTRTMTPAALPVGIVAINIAGSSGGLVMPQVMGIARQVTGGFTGPTLLVVGALLMAALLVLLLRLIQKPAVP